MLVLFLTVYEFVSATGSWSTHSGFGAFVFFALFCAALGWGLVLAFMAPSLPTKMMAWGVRSIFGKNAGRVALNVIDAIDLIVNTWAFMVPIIILAIVSFLLYLFGFGSFAEGGWLLSSTAHMNWFDWFAIGYVAFSNYSFFDRFNIK